MRFALLCSLPAVSQRTTSDTSRLRRGERVEQHRAGIRAFDRAGRSRTRRGLPRSRAGRPPPRGTCPPRIEARACPRLSERWAILPMVVVLPTPFTPMTSTTLGVVERSSARVAHARASSIKISRSACLTSSPRWMLFSYTTLRSSFTASCRDRSRRGQP